MVKPSDILRAARALIVSKKQDLLCYAINYCGTGTVEQRTALIEDIRKFLGSSHTYTSWLKKHDPERFKTDSREGGLRGARLIWIDNLIQEQEMMEKNRGAA
jgi:hypothetical protein